MDYDFSWKEPTKAQIAALHHACRCIGGKVEQLPAQHLWHSFVVNTANHRAHMVDNDHFDYVLNDFDLAEMMLSSGGSLWFHEAVAWETDPVAGYGPAYKLICRIASRFVVKVVKWGYQDGKWWDLEAIVPDPMVRANEVTALIEFNRMTYKLTHPAGPSGALHALLTDDCGPIMSSGWRMPPTLLVPKLKINEITRLLGSESEGAAAAALATVRAHLDPVFRKKFNSAKREAKRRIRDTYEPIECIHPECRNLVAPTGIKPREGHYKNYRGTGACQMGHNSYFCTRCNGPHNFVSNFGEAHYPKYYGKNWDGTNMEGEK